MNNLLKDALKEQQVAEIKVVTAKKTAKKAVKKTATTAKKAVKKTATTAKKAVATSKVAEHAETQAVRASVDNVAIHRYSYTSDGNVKSYVVRGEGTKAIRSAIRSIPARYNSFLQGGGGWIFAAKHLDNAKKIIAEAIITQKK